MHDQRGHIELLEILGEVGLGKCLDSGADENLIEPLPVSELLSFKRLWTAVAQSRPG